MREAFLRIRLLPFQARSEVPDGATRGGEGGKALVPDHRKVESFAEAKDENVLHRVQLKSPGA